MTGEGRTLVLGIGNPEQGDDAAGRVVARLLRSSLSDHVEIIELDGEATALLEHLEDATAAFMIDACKSGAPVGTVRRINVGVEPLPQAAFGLSTHSFGLREAIGLARALGKLPSHCIVYAIEGRSFEIGQPLSPAVAAATHAVVDRLCAELSGNEQTSRGAACTKPL
jgi:hydrogenase maturation protease